MARAGMAAVLVGAAGGAGLGWLGWVNFLTALILGFCVGSAAFRASGMLSPVTGSLWRRLALHVLQREAAQPLLEVG